MLLQELCWGLAGLGLIQRRRGRLDEAIAASSEAAELAQAIPDLAFLISAPADVGRSYLRQGRLEEAFAALEASQEVFEDHIGPDSYVSLRNGLAEAHLSAAEGDFQGRGGRLAQRGPAILSRRAETRQAISARHAGGHALAGHL